MNMQNMMKLAAQHAEEQRQAQEQTKMMDTFRLLILATTVNELTNQDTIDKTLQKSADKVAQSFLNDVKTSDDDSETLKAIANLSKVEVKRLLNETAKIMRVKS